MQSDRSFRMMALKFRFRDLMHPPWRLLSDAGVRAGMTVLDFGCGPGGFAVAAGRLVGRKGRVYALDANPLALRYTERAVARARLDNVQTVLADNTRGIETGTVDVALLYDVFHHIPDKAALLADLARVLRPGGTLSVNDHHMEDDALAAAVTSGALFRRTAQHAHTIDFRPVTPGEAGA